MNQIVKKRCFNILKTESTYLCKLPQHLLDKWSFPNEHISLQTSQLLPFPFRLWVLEALSTQDFQQNLSLLWDREGLETVC